jgi:hypothetical protein
MKESQSTFYRLRNCGQSETWNEEIRRRYGVVDIAWKVKEETLRHEVGRLKKR